jgi:hypothetical protein
VNAIAGCERILVQVDELDDPRLLSREDCGATVFETEIRKKASESTQYLSVIRLFERLLHA